MKFEHLIMLFLLLGTGGSWLLGSWVEGAPPPQVCFLWFYGGCMALVLLLSLLAWLYARAEALVNPHAEVEGGGLLFFCLLLAMWGGFLVHEFGSAELQAWWLKAVLVFAACVLLAFVLMLAVVWLRRRRSCRADALGI